MSNTSLSSRRRPRRSLLSSDEEDGDLDLFAPSQKMAAAKSSHQHPKVAKSQTIEGLRRDCDLFATLASSGMCLDETRDLESPHSLTIEQAMFKKKVAQTLKSNALYPTNLNKFTDEFFRYLETDQKVLVKSLIPMRPCPDSSQDAESLVRVLLNVECLQPALSSWLLEKLALVSLENEGSSGRNSNHDSLTENVPKLILNNLRWLNIVTNGEALADKLLEILDATPEHVQVEIIGSLPEIIPDSFHSKIALALDEKMTATNLTPAILDTFTNLTLKPEALMKLRKSVMKSLGSASNEDLPIMVKFLVSCVDSTKEAIGEIDELRDNLNLDKPDHSIGVLSQIVNSQRMMSKKSKKHDKAQ